MRRALLTALALLAAGLLAACAGTDEASPPAQAAPPTSAPTAAAPDEAASAADGIRAGRARLFLPAGKSRATVVLLHGWNDLDPAAYAPWIGHLTERGVAVVFPDYQEGLLSLPAAMLAGAEEGIRDGLAEARARGSDGPVIAAGYSLGGGYAVAYAAQAEQWGVTPPQAVYAVFPAEPPGLPEDLGPVPADTTVELVVGDRDRVVGQAGADALARRIAPHPVTLRVLTSNAQATYDHFAPKGDDAQARADFWAPLDRLVDRAAPPG